MGLTGHFQWDLPVILNGIARSLSVGLSSSITGRLKFSEDAMEVYVVYVRFLGIRKL